jgi:hypothetical protein
LREFKQQQVTATTGDARRRSRWFPQWSFLPAPAWATAAVISLFALIAAVVLWATYPASRRVEQTAILPPASDQPTPGPEQPSPTDHTGQTNPPSTPSPQNGETVPPPKDQPLIVV